MELIVSLEIEVILREVGRRKGDHFLARKESELVTTTIRRFVLVPIAGKWSTVSLLYCVAQAVSSSSAIANRLAQLVKTLGLLGIFRTKSVAEHYFPHAMWLGGGTGGMG